MKKVTDPLLLMQLEGKVNLNFKEPLSPEDMAAIQADAQQELQRQPKKVTDPQLLSQLNGNANPVQNADPTDGNGFWQNAAIGAGKSVYDTGRSLGQMARVVMPDKAADAMGLPTQTDIDEAKRLDQAIMNTGGGVVGNVAGAIGQSLIPGTGQLKAGKVIGDLWSMGGALNKAKAVASAAGLGAAQTALMNPRGSDGSLLGQLATGGAMGVGGQLVGAGGSAAYQAARHVMAGKEGTTGRILASAGQADAGDLADAIQAGNKTLVEGSTPTTSQAAMNPGISQLERTVRNVGFNPLVENDQLQNAARLNALDNIEGIGPLALSRNEAGENAGAAIRNSYDFVRNGVKEVERGLYQSPLLKDLSFSLPTEKINAAIAQYYPGQTFSEAPALLRKMAGVESSVSHEELQKMRSLAYEMSRDKFNTDQPGRAAALAVKDVLSDVYDNAMRAGEEKLTVTGDGVFGPQYGNLAGDPENAIAHLLRTGQGEVPSAATNPVAGDISLVAGHPVKKGQGAYGLMHIDAQGRIDALQKLPELLTQGSPYSRLLEKSGNLLPKSNSGRFYLGDGDYEALIRNDFDGVNSEPWNHTAYKVYDSEKLPVGITKSTKAGDFTPPAQFQGETTDKANIALNPRTYRDIMPDDAAEILKAARQYHILRKENLESGPGFLMTQQGRDGLPTLNGAEIPKAFFNSKASQLSDMAQFGKMFPGQDDSWQALRNYALSDLKHSATKSNGLLSDATMQKWVKNHDGALKGLLNTEQAASLKTVADDVSRAEKAAGLGQARGSNTAQNLLGNTLLDSPLVNLLFNKIPISNQLTGPILTTLRDAQKRQIAQQVGDALLNPDVAIDSLRRHQGLKGLTKAQKGLLSISPLLGGSVGGGLISSLESR